MRERPTLETNAARRPHGLRACADGLAINQDIKFAQKAMRQAADRMEELERERDEAREVLENYKSTTIHSCHDQCERPMCVMRRERDEAREQRNALAASLEYIASGGLTARHCEDEARKMLALVFEKEDGE
jgi:hypothetical protein